MLKCSVLTILRRYGHDCLAPQQCVHEDNFALCARDRWQIFVSRVEASVREYYCEPAGRARSGPDAARQRCSTASYRSEYGTVDGTMQRGRGHDCQLGAALSCFIARVVLGNQAHCAVSPGASQPIVSHCTN
jgi:hypothetical protein